MFKKKIFIILLVFLVGICAISSASASENITDTVAADAILDDAPADLDEDLGSEIQEENADDAESPEVLASPQDEDTLSGVTVSHMFYSIDLNDDGYEISGTKGGTITYSMTPCQTMGVNAYNFFFALFQIDENGNLTLASKTATISSDTSRTIGNYKYTFKAKSVTPGAYILAAVNDDSDKQIMDTAVLKVKGTAVISSSDYNSYYNTGEKMTVKVTDKDTGAPLKYNGIIAEFTNGKTSKTAEYITNSEGQISFIPPLNAGSYNVTFKSGFTHVSASAVKKAVNIKKAPLTVKAGKIKGYVGIKVTLKATVKSQGNNVNEGKVVFKINGKEYSVNVKKGVASKSIKLTKAKTYKYTVKFKGGNFENAKTVSSKAVIKKRTETKVIVKNLKVYRGSTKPFTVQVKTKSGKTVKSGKLTIIDTIKVNKKGKAKFYTGFDLNYIKQVGNTVYFHKKVTKTYKVKYTPTDNAYKPSTKKIKITMVYKCTACGSTKSHSHNGMAFIVT